MTDKYINLRDISPKQRQITCLPFGIIDKDSELIRRLYDAVYKQHKDHPNKPFILKALEDRHNGMLEKRFKLAKLHECEQEKLTVTHQLSGVLPFKNDYMQVLLSDIAIPLSDGFIRFRDQPICFFLNEEQTTWVKIELPDEQQNVNSKNAADLAQAISAARELQKNFTSTSKLNTTNAGSSA